jgi:hypothetical protein
MPADSYQEESKYDKHGMRTGKRLLRLLLPAMLIIVAAEPAAAQSANPAPLHAIVCEYSPDIPVQFGWGGTIYASGSITCTPDPPDVRALFNRWS